MIKKSVLAVLVVLFSNLAVPSSAVTVNKIAIIDAYFDVAQISGKFTQICVADQGCNLSPTNITAAQYTHGSVMARIIRAHAPNAELLLVRAGSIVGKTLYNANGREIASAFAAIPSDVNVVSISIYSNGNGTNDGSACRPASQTMTGVFNVQTELARATAAVNALAARGTVIVAAAGNSYTPKGLDYPACLNNVQSVSLPFRTGTSNPNLDIYVLPVGSDYTGGYLATTSGMTAYVAGNWDLYGNFVKLNSYNKVNFVRPGLPKY